MRAIAIRAAGILVALGLMVIAVAPLMVAPTTVSAGGNIVARAQQTTTADPGRSGTPGGRGTQTATATTATSTTVAPTPTRQPTPTPRAGTLSVSPSSAPAGTLVTVTGTGFSPDARLAVAVEHVTANATAAYIQPSVDTSGNFTVRLDTTGYAAGQHRVTVLALPDPARLTEATFTITSTPGMPATGTGGAAAQPTRLRPLLGGAMIVALFGVAAVLLHRRAYGRR